MPTTLRNTDILFNDGTTQSTAATGVPSSFSAIGSLVYAMNYSTSQITPGSTIAGSSILYVTGGTAIGTGAIRLESTSGGYTVNFSTSNQQISGDRTGNLGAFQPSNTAVLSGTWRVLSTCVARTSSYNSSYVFTTIYYYGALFQRIS